MAMTMTKTITKIIRLIIITIRIKFGNPIKNVKTLKAFK